MVEAKNLKKRGSYLVKKSSPDEYLKLSEIALISKAYWGYSEDLIDLWKSELIVSSKMIENFISYTAFYNDEIVGFWLREPIEDISDGRFFIHPRHIKKGCGRLLWQAVMKEASRRKIKKFVFETDKFALGFYEKMGGRLVKYIDSSYIKGLKLPIVEVIVD